MEEKDLTTVEEPQVNVEEQTIDNAEVVPDEQAVEEPANTQEYKEAYDKIWDKDINDVDVLNEMSEPTTEEHQVGNPFEEDTSTNGTNNSIGAFMSEKPVLKYKGKDVPIDSADELIALAQKGFSYETEMSNIKPKKRILNIVENIPLEVLQAVADLHSGKAEAINYLKSAYGIKEPKAESNDSFWEDSNEDSVSEPATDYKPAVTDVDPITEFWNEYTKTNQQMAAKVNETYAQLDESFKAEVYQPDVFPAFVQSVESGEFDSVYPIAVKEKTLNPAMTWIQAYQIAVGKNGTQNRTVTEPPAAATPPKAVDTGRTMSGDAAADRVWNDPDYFAKLEAQIFS